jgi:hypothetical protein
MRYAKEKSLKNNSKVYLQSKLRGKGEAKKKVMQGREARNNEV